MNILTVLIVASGALLSFYIKHAYFRSSKEILIPEPGSSLFIVTDAMNGYGQDLVTTIAEKDYHVLGIVRTLADAEFLRGAGLGKMDALVWTSGLANDTCIVRNEVAASLASYVAMNITIHGMVVVLTPSHFYDNGNLSEMSGFEFSIETISEVLMSLIMIQEVLHDHKDKSMRIVLVAPYIPPRSMRFPIV